MTAGPDIGKQVAHVSAGGLAGELIEHIAEIRPRVEPMPRRAGADAQQVRGTARVAARLVDDRGGVRRPGRLRAGRPDDGNRSRVVPADGVRGQADRTVGGMDRLVGFNVLSQP